MIDALLVVRDGLRWKLFLQTRTSYLMEVLSLSRDELSDRSSSFRGR